MDAGLRYRDGAVVGVNYGIAVGAEGDFLCCILTFIRLLFLPTIELNKSFIVLGSRFRDCVLLRILFMPFLDLFYPFYSSRGIFLACS